TQLIIYDVLGREVATLVNEESKAGVYSVDWNGTNYPSGVYFYKLEAGVYTETKKMVLLK
ncbi:MAG: T9SS type A sorting domain-containing protein, partial [Ignavibacteria bacterium]